MVSFKTILGFLLILLVASIVILSVVCYQNNENVIRASTRVHDSYQVIQKSDEISSAYQKALLGVNRIIITRDTSRSVASMHELFFKLGQLRELAARCGDQKAAIDSLETGFQRFKSISDSLINLVRRGYPEDRIEEVFINTIQLRDDVSSRINDIKQKQSGLLEQHELANRTNLAAFTTTFLALLVGIAILLVSAFFVVRYHFNKRQKAQDELTQAKLLFEKIFYESPIAIVISEFETGKILNCNKVFSGIVNYEIYELIGKTSVELGIFGSNEKRKEIIDAAVGNGMTRHTEVLIKPKDKDPVYISIDAHIIRLFDKRCMLTAILDLSTHKRAEDEIKKALETEIELNKLKSNLVTLASHEFRTPLTTILSSAFLLENFMVGEHREKSAKHLTRIKSAVSNLTSILDEFLSVTKIEEGQIKPNFETTDLPKYLAGICANLQTFAKPGQTIHYSHSGDREIETDPVLLGNILSNLVTNSIKYSDENSPIVVTSLVNSRIHLTVQDKGIGIPEADQKRLFERFYRASNAGAIQGTGLGLHIMKHYVEMLHGTVKLTSEPCKGTQVEITFDHP